MIKKTRTATTLRHLIAKTWRETKKGKHIRTKEDYEVLTALCNTLLYLSVYGGQRGENHKDYFIALYLSTYNNLSQLKLSLAYNICADTVADYSLLYIKIFEFCYNSVKGRACIDSTLISALLRALKA